MKAFYKKLLLLPLLAVFTMVLVPQSKAQTSNGDFGLGFILGEPTGLSGKLFLGESRALDFGAAWSFGNNSNLHLHADYLIHRFDLIRVDSGQMP
jgi:hypothetical protein